MNQVNWYSSWIGVRDNTVKSERNLGSYCTTHQNLLQKTRSADKIIRFKPTTMKHHIRGTKGCWDSPFSVMASKSRTSEITVAKIKIRGKTGVSGGSFTTGCFCL